MEGGEAVGDMVGDIVGDCIIITVPFSTITGT